MARSDLPSLPLSPTRTKPRPKVKGKAASPEPEENLCLMRASNGKRTISTVISAREVTRFQMVSRVRTGSFA